MAEEKKNESPGFPPLDFETLITEYSTTAMAYLGGMPDPETQEPIFNLQLAKRMIDTIDLLKEKTKGNLSTPESNFLENTLYSLKMTYVRAVQSSASPGSGKEADESETADEDETTDDSETNTEDSSES